MDTTSLSKDISGGASSGGGPGCTGRKSILSSQHKNQNNQQQTSLQQKKSNHHHQNDIAIMLPPSVRYNNRSPSPLSPTQPGSGEAMSGIIGVCEGRTGAFMQFPPPSSSSASSTSISLKQTATRKLHRYPGDPDIIELCNVEGVDSELFNSVSNFKESANERSNGMHQIEISQNWPISNNSGPSTSQQHHQQDYSYAYYEPGAAMRHSNIPIPGTSYDRDMPSTSRAPPPNSIRALLSKTKRNNLPSSAHIRHTYTTRYGTQENIYEEIGSDGRIRMIQGHSMISLNQSMVEEEFRRVQSRHRRVLGELNLSVEAMIMPSTPPSDSPTEDNQPTSKGSAKNNLNELLNSVGPTDELLSPVGSHVIVGGELDSGFSGSSSGASYVGTLRYQKTNSQMTTRSSNLVVSDRLKQCANYNTSNIRLSQRSYEDPEFSPRLSSINCVKSSKDSPQRAAEDPGPLSITQAKSQKTSFWRKGWRKFPGFSSTTSVNKAGTGESR